jgi:SPOR domain
MADDNSSRGYRASDPFARSQPAAAPGSTPAKTSDPLAELARLIGQNDPFADPAPVNADNAPHAATEGARSDHWRAAEPAAPDHQWRIPESDHWRAAETAAPDHWRTAEVAPTAYVNPPSEQAAPATPQYPAVEPYQTAQPAPPYSPMPEPGTAPPHYDSQAQYDSQAYAEQHFDPAPAPAFQPAYDTAAYGAVPANAPGYEPDPYYRDETRMPAPGEDIYDAPAPRRRSGLAIAMALIGLAVAGSAAAYGYRTYFSGTHSSKPPPVIHADAAPKKVVPPSQTKDQSAKLINDRLSPGEGEKVVPREEKPLDVKSSTAPPPPKVVMPIPIKNNDAPMHGAAASATPSLVPPQPSAVLGQPKRVHTVVIRPDHPPAGAAPAWPTPAAPTPQARPVPGPAAHAKPTPPPAPAARVASTRPPPVSVELPPSKPHAASPRRTQHTQHTPRPPTRSTRSDSAPLSIVPQGAPAPARQAAPAQPRSPTQLASAPSAPAPRASAPHGGYAVQVSSRRSERDARAAFHQLQARFPKQLGGRTPIIRRANLGARGIYYRAMVGLFATAEAASALCSSLKAAGGSCLVQRN